MAEKPRTLKDLLELDSSESFRCSPYAGAATLRRLLDTELCSSVSGDKDSAFQARSHSKTALARLSNIIKAVNALQFFTPGSANSATSLLHRSFSKKLSRAFWKRSFDDEKEVEISASSPQKEISDGVADADNRESKKNENCGNTMECPLGKEKEQFSPVSVMEFPYKNDEDDEEVEQQSTTTTCSEQSLTSIETKKNQLRRFESRAELDPVDLNSQFVCTETNFESTVHVAYEDEEDRLYRKAFYLLRQFAGGVTVPANEEKLLFDFFIEGLSLSEHCRMWRSGSAGEELIPVATRWFSGEVWPAVDCNMLVGEMERSGGWRRFEEEIVAAEMSRSLIMWLIDELVSELWVTG